MIQVERVYGHTAADGSTRFLVERLWPRGVKKESLKMQAWLKDVAPSAELRQWYSHDVAKWVEFRRRYERELAAHPDTWKPILDAARRGDVTLLYSARDTEHNSAIVLKEFLERKMKR